MGGFGKWGSFELEGDGMRFYVGLGVFGLVMEEGITL